MFPTLVKYVFIVTNKPNRAGYIWLCTMILLLLLVLYPSLRELIIPILCDKLMVRGILVCN